MTGPLGQGRGRAVLAPLPCEPSGRPGAASAGDRWRRIGAVGVAALALAGCVNPFAPEGTDVGVYKGATDPLYEQPADERNAALRKRFELIQSR